MGDGVFFFFGGGWGLLVLGGRGTGVVALWGGVWVGL